MYHHKYGMYHVSLIKAFIFQAWHVSYIIIYLLSMAYIIKAKYQRKASTHMDTNFFTWKPSDWGENHGSFTKLYHSQRWWGQQPLTIYFTSLLLEGEHNSLLYNHFPGYNRKGIQPLHAYYVGPNTTLPPWNDKNKKDSKRSSAHCQRLSGLTDRLEMTLTDSNKLSTKVLCKLKVKLHFDWLTPHNWQEGQPEKTQEGHN